MKYKIALAAAVFGITLAFPAAGEEITNYDVSVSVSRDSSITVSETISYDFGGLQRHGIFRDIPYSYSARGGIYKLRISDIAVEDGSGEPVKFSTSSESGVLRIKIGDPDEYVTGGQIYSLSYRVRRAVNFFEDRDELYWNAIGTDWPVAIKSARVAVNLPDSQQPQIACYKGAQGSNRPCDVALAAKGGAEFSAVGLGSGEGMTVVVAVGKGVIVQPAWWQNILDTVKDNLILALPLLTLIVMGWLWHKRGRDPAGRGTVVAEYEPPDNLQPIQVGTLADLRADNRDVSAEIISLATRGYLRITRIEKKRLLLGSTTDYLLQRLREPSDLSDEFDRTLMDALFKKGELTADSAAFGSATDAERLLADARSQAGGTSAHISIRLSELKNEFYKDLKTIKEQAYQSLVGKKYYETNPNKVRGFYSGIGASVMIAGFWIGNFWGGLGIVSLIASGIIIILFGLVMPAKTPSGAIALERTQGFREYLSVAEGDRIRFHNAPDKTPERFERFLPYAMAFGVEQQWAKQFEGIYNSQPSWYNDSSGKFSAVYLASSLGNFSTAANASLASSPRSAAGAPWSESSPSRGRRRQRARRRIFRRRFRRGRRRQLVASH